MRHFEQNKQRAAPKLPKLAYVHMKHPNALDNRQKTLAAWLANGLTPAEAAQRVGVSKVYVEQLLKGGLFQFEVDEARQRLIHEQMGAFTEALANELSANLAELVSIRDTAKDDRTRLAAVVAMLDRLVPRPQPHSEPETRVSITLSNEKAAEVKEVLKEVDVLSARDNDPLG